MKTWDSDHDGTIDSKESLAAIGNASFAKADVNKDGTLDKSEYLNLVEARFNAADTDHDGTVSEYRAQHPRREIARKSIVKWARRGAI